MTSQLKVDRISPATGSEIIIDGFSGGITCASQWRLTTDFAGSAHPISLNLESVSSPLGLEMTQENGIFTFPEIGYWKIDAYANWTDATNSGSSRSRMYISVTTNNLTYETTSNAWGGTYYTRTTGTCSYILNVTDVSQCKVKFGVDQATSDPITKGNSSFNETFFNFTRLAGN